AGADAPEHEHLHGKGSAGGVRDDLATDRERRDPGTDRGDDARPLETHPPWERRGVRTPQPAVDLPVRGVEGGRAHVDEHLPLARLADLEVDHLEHLGAPVSGRHDGPRHAASTFSIDPPSTRRVYMFSKIPSGSAAARTAWKSVRRG